MGKNRDTKLENAHLRNTGAFKRKSPQGFSKDNPASD